MWCKDSALAVMLESVPEVRSDKREIRESVGSV